MPKLFDFHKIEELPPSQSLSQKVTNGGASMMGVFVNGNHQQVKSGAPIINAGAGMVVQ